MSTSVFSVYLRPLADVFLKINEVSWSLQGKHLFVVLWCMGKRSIQRARRAPGFDVTEDTKCFDVASVAHCNSPLRN